MNSLLWWQLAGLLLLMTATLLHRSSQMSFQLFAVGFGLALLVVLGTGLVALVSSLMTAWRQGVAALSWPQWLVPGVGLVLIIWLALVLVKSRSVPPIHDVATDWTNPLLFSTVAQLRQPADNSLAIDPLVVVQQQRAYPQVVPLWLTIPPQEAFNKALALCQQLGWQVQRQDKTTHTIEASTSSTVFGFVDDVSIRIQASDQGSRVDMRSASRVGKSDLGANAQRITDFLARLQRP